MGSNAAHAALWSHSGALRHRIDQRFDCFEDTLMVEAGRRAGGSDRLTDGCEVKEEGTAEGKLRQ